MTQNQLPGSFASLEPGDVVTHPGKSEEFIVLSTRENGGKQFGLVCDCGNHVRGIPRLFYWNEKLGMPATIEGQPLTKWDGKLLVEPGKKKELAEKFACLAVGDDYHQAIGDLPLKHDDTVKAFKILTFSNTTASCSTIAALKAIGVEISPHQAAAFIVAMEAQAAPTGLDIVGMEMVINSFEGTFRH